MKKSILFGFFFCFCLLVRAQEEFEGTVVYETELTGKGAALLKGMLPDIYVFQFKGKDVRVELLGGLMGSMFWPVISVADSGRAFMIDEDNKIAYSFIPSDYNKPKYNPISLEDMEKDKKIGGYNCHQERIVLTSNNGSSQVDIWSTTELPMVIPNNNPLSKTLVYPGTEGFPLLIESQVEHQSTTFTYIIRLRSVKKETLEPAIFRIPAKFTIQPFDVLQYGTFDQ